MYLFLINFSNHQYKIDDPLSRPCFGGWEVICAKIGVLGGRGNLSISALKVASCHFQQTFRNKD